MNVNISCKTGESSIACAAALHVASVIPNISWGLTLTHTGLGEDVTAGEVVGRMHFPERPDRAPVDVQAGSSGVVCSIRAIAATQQGDCLVVTGRRCGREELL